MKPSEIATFGIGLFGVALLTGWMPDYTMTFFADFAFKGKGFDSAQLAHVIPIVFGVAGIVGAILGKIPVLGGILSALISLATLALMIIGILNAANGKAKQLPLIGNLLHVFDK